MTRTLAEGATGSAPLQGNAYQPGPSSSETTATGWDTDGVKNFAGLGVSALDFLGAQQQAP
jgi:hypothetical protein